MVEATETIKSMINSPIRQIKARVELLEGSTLLNTFAYEDRLKSFTVERIGEGKFFGYGICQRLNVKVIDTKRELNIKTSNVLEVVFGVNNEYMYALPPFKVSEVHRNEDTNELSITAYDWLYQASRHTIGELDLPSNYSIETIAGIIANALGLNLRLEGLDESFYTYYPNGANLDGTETLRELLDAIAEATQTIYYVDNQWNLVFKRMDMREDAVISIDKEKYFTLKSKTNRRLVAICSATELGDNVKARLKESGTTQYVRDNPFWDMRDDIDVLVSSALNAVGGFTINQFECKWRGNFLIEIGDKIALTTKDNEIVFSYLLDDTISYDGTYSQITKWNYTENEAENESNAATLGGAIRQTYARVDKVNKQIDLVASEAKENANNITAIQMNTENINATVQTIEQNSVNAVNSIKSDIEEINKKVSATMSKDDIKLEIQTEISNGVRKVSTATGYTFNEEGLTVSKTDSEMKTQITEDGMTVYKNDEAVLTANNVGVDAVNLHATTYLIIGTNSRFEDYGSDRTGCFWIGEVN